MKLDPKKKPKNVWTILFFVAVSKNVLFSSKTERFSVFLAVPPVGDLPQPQTGTRRQRTTHKRPILGRTQPPAPAPTDR